MLSLVFRTQIYGDKTREGERDGLLHGVGVAGGPLWSTHASHSANSTSASAIRTLDLVMVFFNTQIICILEQQPFKAIKNIFLAPRKFPHLAFQRSFCLTSSSETVGVFYELLHPQQPCGVHFRCSTHGTSPSPWLSMV